MGRPRNIKVDLTISEVAALMDLPEAFVLRRARASFFPGAYEDAEVDGGWVIPESGFKLAMRCTLEYHFKVKTAAAFLGVHYCTLSREVFMTTDLKTPLPPGKSIRALSLFLGDSKPRPRIPESELKRVLGGNRYARA